MIITQSTQGKPDLKRTFFVLNFGFNVLDGIGRFDLKSDGLANCLLGH